MHNVSCKQVCRINCDVQPMYQMSCIRLAGAAFLTSPPESADLQVVIRTDSGQKILNASLHLLPLPVATYRATCDPKTLHTTSFYLFIFCTKSWILARDKLNSQVPQGQRTADGFRGFCFLLQWDAWSVHRVVSSVSRRMRRLVLTPCWRRLHCLHFVSVLRNVVTC